MASDDPLSTQQSLAESNPICPLCAMPTYRVGTVSYELAEYIRTLGELEPEDRPSVALLRALAERIDAGAESGRYVAQQTAQYIAALRMLREVRGMRGGSDLGDLASAE